MSRYRSNDDDNGRDESWTEDEYDAEYDAESEEGPDDDSSEDDESSTMPCPRCRREVWEDADRCPRCGYYLTDDEMEEEERSAGPGFKWKWVSIALLAVFALGLWRLMRA